MDHDVEPVCIPDIRFWQAQVKCQDACPVHTDARGYVRAIAAGNYEQAYLIARGPNPLASICGRICGAPCEMACRRGSLDRPVAIRALKRFVCERLGPEAREEGGAGLIRFLKSAAAAHPQRDCEGSEELLPLLRSTLRGDVPLASGQSVGIVGSGPAGLAAAHDLALLGFEVTIYEVEPVLGGMLAVGVPAYRLPRSVIEAEVQVIQELGVIPVTNCEVGEDVSLAELRVRHDAVVVAVGAKRSRYLDIPGADAEGVLGGVEFLKAVALGDPPTFGARVVVIGGGNVAYDVGRTVLRQISVDAARMAMREPGVADVYLCSLESLSELPADDVEIIEGDEEGIVRRHGVGPVEIVTGESGQVTGVLFRRCLSVYNEEGRFAPVFDDDERELVACDNVLLAVGQSIDLQFVDEQRDGLKLTARGFIECDPETGRTNAPDVFVAGDLATGPGLLIHAVASGKRVARSVYEALTGCVVSHRDMELHLVIPRYRREPGYEGLRRVPVPTTPVAERMRSHDVPVEIGFSEVEARLEARRCLDCGVNTIFDAEKCILCGACVEICPERCLAIVSAASLGGGDELTNMLEEQLDGLPPEEASAIVKDETICIRCAMCADRCPVGAITMRRFRFAEALTCQGSESGDP